MGNDDKKKDTDTSGLSEVKTGAPVVAVKPVSADNEGLDMNTLKQAFMQLKARNDALEAKLAERENEDADTVRKVIIQKTTGWKRPFTMDEIKDGTLEDLDRLNELIDRAPEAPEKHEDKIEKVSTQLGVGKTRLFPKLSSDSKPYDTATHKFSIGQ